MVAVSARGCKGIALLLDTANVYLHWRLCISSSIFCPCGSHRFGKPDDIKSPFRFYYTKLPHIELQVELQEIRYPERQVI